MRMWSQLQKEGVRVDPRKDERVDTVDTRHRRRHATTVSSDFFCVPFGGALISASADSTHTAAKPEAHRSRRQNSAPHTMLWRPPKAVWTGYKPKKQDDH